ncbi:MAG: Fe-S cluster assembly sulfur transfer protein SufU [Kiritimatiellia bacterium]
MTQAADLYQDIILHYSRSPRHFGKLDSCTHHIKADNPLCGDSYELFLQIDNEGIIRNGSFQGAGCAISKASTSIMLDSIIGKPATEAEALFTRFQRLVKEPGSAESQDPEMGKLAAFSGVWKFPSRVKCAILSWHAMHELLHQQAGTSDQTEG